MTAAMSILMMSITPLLAFDDATGEVIGCYRLITEETAKVGGWYSEHEFDLSL